MSVKITTKLKATPLGEIYQTMQQKQALCVPISDTEYERITPFVLCRDFLVDVYTFLPLKQKWNVYGMTFDGETYIPSHEAVYVLLQFANTKDRARFEEHLDLLHSLEKKNSIPQTRIQHVDDLQILVIGHKKWLRSCLLLSLYTFMLRAWCYKFTATPDTWPAALSDLQNSNEGRYAKSVDPSTWKAVLKDLDLLVMPTFCGFNVQTTDRLTVHHNSGFFSVFGKHSEQSPPSVKENSHWKRAQSIHLQTAIV
jgi:hypothetical protein